DWSLACMTAGAALLPAIALSGSPTYAIFVILMSTVVLARGWVAAEEVLEHVGRRWIVAAILLVSLASGALRIGVVLPIASRLAQPLLAEREKSSQLEIVIDWMLNSEYRSSDLILEDSRNPAASLRDAIDRRRRPPTYQLYLDEYLASQRSPGRN